jgi:hypothetical protein
VPERPKRTESEILRDLKETFQLVELGLADLLGGDLLRRTSGLRNLVVYGHATTQTLQNLRGVNPDFDGWYMPIREEMQGDPLMKYFWDLRSRILKQGTIGGPEINVKTHIKIKGDVDELIQNPPPRATNRFFGDLLGGSGWEIELPDGTTEVYYSELPPSVTVDHRFLFENPPTIHNGRAIDDTSAQELSRLYVKALRNIVDRAEVRLGSSKSD